LPPLEEQVAIIHALQSAIDPLNSFLAESAKALALLLERRAALISAAVTGKIDVRGLVEADAPIPDVIAA
jgi:type I restriction enzyme S subunit